MTVSSANRKAGPFLGNGVTTSFPFTFKVFKEDDVLVTYTDLNGADTELVLNSQYSVALNGDQNVNPGGTVTYPILGGDPLPSGTKLTLTGDLAYTQPTDLPNLGPYFAEVVEDAFDRATIQIQQLEEISDRSIKISVSDTPLTPLPAAASRANMLIGFDALGNVTVVPQPSSIGAGDRIAFTLVNGTDFNAGTSTQITLPRAPGAPGNLELFFDPLFQGFDQWSVNGLIVTFTDVIPVGVTKIFGYIGTTLSMQIPPDGSVTTTKLVPGSVTTPIIADDAVTREKLVDSIIVDVLVDPNAGIQSSKLSFLQAGTNAIARTVQSRLREYISVFDFMTTAQIVDVQNRTAAVDVSGPIQTALAALDNLGICEIYFPPGDYRTTVQISVLNKRIKIRGAGQQATRWRCEMTTGIGLYIQQDDYTQFTTVEGITFLTNQLSTVDGLVIQYGESDATNNRVQDRVTLRDLSFYGSVIGLVGHKRAILLTNVHAASLSDINICGQSYAAGMLAGVELASAGTGAPADITFRNVKVYYGAIGFKGTGHLEGINFSQCFAIAVQVGWDFRLSAAYPWFTMSQCHANVTSQGVHLENFAQSFISRNLIYIVNHPAASTPVGISLNACDDTIVSENNVVNPTFLAGTTVVGYLSQNCQRTKLANNKVAGYNVGYWIDGTSDFNRTFDNEASTPYGGAIGYNMTASGGSNTVRNTP